MRPFLFLPKFGLSCGAVAFAVSNYTILQGYQVEFSDSLLFTAKVACITSVPPLLLGGILYSVYKRNV